MPESRPNWGRNTSFITKDKYNICLFHNKQIEQYIFEIHMHAPSIHNFFHISRYTHIFSSIRSISLSGIRIEKHYRQRLERKQSGPEHWSIIFDPQEPQVEEYLCPTLAYEASPSVRLHKPTMRNFSPKKKNKLHKTINYYVSVPC